MSTPLSKASVNKVGTCPHGLPMGACPICSGMGGGGVKRDNRPKEMTWNECYAIGQMLKAQKMARKQTMQMYAAQDMKAYLNRLQEQITAIKNFVQNNFPKPIANAVTFLANTVLVPVARLIATVATSIKSLAAEVQKTFDNIKQKLADISDKLTAMLGEAKAAIEKKISEKFKDIKKKVFNLFGISSADNEEDEELEKIEEEKQIFEMTQTKETKLEKNQIQEEESNKQ